MILLMNWKAAVEYDFQLNVVGVALNHCANDFEKSFYYFFKSASIIVLVLPCVK